MKNIIITLSLLAVSPIIGMDLATTHSLIDSKIPITSANITHILQTG